MINRIKKTSGVVRESADILSTRIRIDSLCECVSVYLYGSIVSFRSSWDSLFSILLCNFVLRRVKQQRDSPRRGSPSLFPVSLRILSIVLSSHREYSPMLEQNDVRDIPRYITWIPRRNHVSSWQMNHIDRTFRVWQFREFSTASSS